MTTNRAFTTIEQSRKLAEILPLESADMVYTITNGYHTPWIRIEKIDELDKDDVCAWSLAALLSVLPDSIYDNTNEFSQLEFSKKSVAYHDMNDEIKIGILKDNLVDACYEMILKLHELNLL